MAVQAQLSLIRLETENSNKQSLKSCLKFEPLKKNKTFFVSLKGNFSSTGPFSASRNAGSCKFPCQLENIDFEEQMFIVYVAGFLCIPFSSVP